MSKALPSNNSNPFTGFSPKALKFFTELDAHQNLEWFHANKARYEELIRAPLGSFVDELTQQLAAHNLPLKGDAKTSLFRINRDIRFSKDKRPYKTNASAVLTRDGTKHAPGLFYLQIGPDECFMAVGFYAIDPPTLESFRRAIVRQSEKWRAVVQELKSHKLNLSREDTLARLPRGYQTNALDGIDEDLKLKSFVVRQVLDKKLIETSALIPQAVKFIEASKPLLTFGWKVLGK